MATYIIKHVLPGGTIAGYHGDSCCTITHAVEEAKTYEADTPDKVAEQLRIVRKNFEYVWGLETSEFGGGPDYRNYSCWKGFPLEQIQTVAEPVS